MDYAVTPLYPGLTYLPEIRKIGPIANKNTITVEQAASLSYQVRKVGRTTGLTGGIVDLIAGQGETSSRTYEDAIVIKANPVGSKTDVHFAYIGDLGSAIVNDANEIVGLLFAARPPSTSVPPIGEGLAIPFHSIEDDLLQKNIRLELETAATDGDVRTVPGGGEAAMTEGRARSAHLQVGQEREATWQRFSSDLEGSARGRVLLDLYRRHADEVSDLIRHNRAVASAWHHNSLPSLVQALHHALDDPTAPLPDRPRGRAWSRAIDQVVQAFGRHGSAALRADARHYRDMIPELDSATMSSGRRPCASLMIDRRVRLQSGDDVGRLARNLGAHRGRVAQAVGSLRHWVSDEHILDLLAEFGVRFPDEILSESAFANSLAEVQAAVETLDEAAATLGLRSRACPERPLWPRRRSPC